MLVKKSWFDLNFVKSSRKYWVVSNIVNNTVGKKHRKKIAHYYLVLHVQEFNKFLAMKKDVTPKKHSIKSFEIKGGG